MSVSDLIGLISGLLQFAVACYAVRVSRRFGVPRVGWPFFAAFSLLAIAHVLQTFQTVLRRAKLRQNRVVDDRD